MRMQTVVYSVLTQMQVNTGIMVSILSSNNLCTVADNGELLTCLYHSKSTWIYLVKTGLSVCLCLFPILSLEATQRFYIMFGFSS